MQRKRITWAEAEQVCPGIEAEWRSMLGTKRYTETLLDGRKVRLPMPCPPTGSDWRVELTDDNRVVVVQVDHEGRYHSPPEWHCHELGYWTNPMAIPKGLLFYQDFKYDFSGKKLDGESYIHPRGFVPEVPTKTYKMITIAGPAVSAIMSGTRGGEGGT